MMPLLIGFCFGWLLERAGLGRYDRIVGIYRLRDFTVLKFLGSGLAVGALALQVALWLGLASAAPAPATVLYANLVGGGLFGIGMATGGFCPGTIVAGAGAGQLDYLGAGATGLLFGAAIADRLPLHATGRVITLADLTHASAGLIAIFIAELALVGFYALERGVRPPMRAREWHAPMVPLRKVG